MAKPKHTPEQRKEALERKKELAKQGRKRKRDNFLSLQEEVQTLRDRVKHLEELLFRPIAPEDTEDIDFDNLLDELDEWIE